VKITRQTLQGNLTFSEYTARFTEVWWICRIRVTHQTSHETIGTRAWVLNNPEQPAYLPLAAGRSDRLDRDTRFSPAPRKSNAPTARHSVLRQWYWVTLQVFHLPSGHRKVYTTAVTTYITPLITPEKVRATLFSRIKQASPSRESLRVSRAYAVRVPRMRARVCVCVVCMCMCMCVARVSALIRMRRITQNRVRAYMCVRVRRCKYARVYEYVCVCVCVCVGVCALVGGMCVGGAWSWTSSVGQRRTNQPGCRIFSPSSSLSLSLSLSPLSLSLSFFLRYPLVTPPISSFNPFSLSLSLSPLPLPLSLSIYLSISILVLLAYALLATMCSDRNVSLRWQQTTSSRTIRPFRSTIIFKIFLNFVLSV